MENPKGLPITGLIGHLAIRGMTLQVAMDLVSEALIGFQVDFFGSSGVSDHNP
jgi:hypothetical protein